MQSLPTSHFGRSPLCIVRNFWVFLSNFSSLSTLHSNTPAPYLIIATAQLFITFILFFPFNLDIKISLILFLYYLTNSVFVSFSLTLSYSSIPRSFYHSSSIVFINFPFGRFKFVVLVLCTSPRLSTKIPHFLIPNLLSSIFTKRMHCIHQWIDLIVWLCK